MKKHIFHFKKSSSFYLIFLFSIISCKNYGQENEKYLSDRIKKFNLKDFEGSVSDFTNYIEYNSKNLKAYAFRGSAYINLGKFSHAEKDLDNIIAIDPKNADAYLKKGICYTELRMYEEARIILNKSLELGMRPSYVYYEIGKTYQRSSDYQKSIDYFSKCFQDLEKRKVVGPAHFESGLSKMSLKDFKGAISDFNKAIEFKWKPARAFQMRGECKYELSDYRGAISDLNLSIEMAPDQGYSFLLRGQSKSHINNREGADLDFGKAFEIYFPGNNLMSIVVLLNKGDNNSKLENYQLAILDYNKILEINENLGMNEDSDALFGKGYCKLSLGDDRGAIEDLTRLLERDKKNSSAYFNRGIARLNIGQKDAGCLDLSRAGELGNKEAYKMITKYCN